MRRVVFDIFLLYLWIYFNLEYNLYCFCIKNTYENIPSRIIKVQFITMVWTSIFFSSGLKRPYGTHLTKVLFSSVLWYSCHGAYMHNNPSWLFPLLGEMTNRNRRTERRTDCLTVVRAESQNDHQIDLSYKFTSKQSRIHGTFAPSIGQRGRKSTSDRPRVRRSDL